MQSMTTMSMLNFGQAIIITIGVTFIMIFASSGVVDGSMTLGDLSSCECIDATVIRTFKYSWYSL